MLSAGPIPARTGQPQHQRVHATNSGAYPRSHGATRQARAVNAVFEGLSPLARGNPSRPRQQRTGRRAYPRSHGATISPISVRERLKGLSPLARGNLNRPTYSEMAKGPIPARTGQPIMGSAAHSRCGAYPRSHGATHHGKRSAFAVWGLSPLARGNRAREQKMLFSGRPIPARTGQPTGQPASQVIEGAYPRSHGATTACHR